MTPTTTDAKKLAITCNECGHEGHLYIDDYSKNTLMVELIAKIRLEEREACAKIAENHSSDSFYQGRKIAEQIRAGRSGG